MNENYHSFFDLVSDLNAALSLALTLSIATREEEKGILWLSILSADRQRCLLSRRRPFEMSLSHAPPIL